MRAVGGGDGVAAVVGGGRGGGGSLTSQQQASVSISGTSLLLRAVTLRQKLQTKLAASTSHSTRLASLSQH